MRGDGSIWERGKNNFWIVYYHRGKRYREKGGRTEKEARDKLRTRLLQIHGGAFIGPKEDRLLISDLVEALLRQLALNGARSIASYRSHLKPVLRHFGHRRAMDVTALDIKEYVEKRLDLGMARATVKKEFSALKQAMQLAVEDGLLSRLPSFPKKFQVSNVRKGFFEPADIERLIHHLEDPIDDAAEFAFETGWRRSEIFGLTWSCVDRAGHEVRLYESKNDEPRVLPLEGALQTIIDRRWSARAYQTKGGQEALSPLVFHRRGKPVADFRKQWVKACRLASLEGRLFHDLRRSAIRNLIRSGVPETVAMAISGHNTRAVFDRYNITSLDDKRQALRKTQQRSARLKGEVVRMRKGRG